MSETQKHTTRNGFITIIGTYIIWGLLPLYFVLMAPAGSIEIVVARVVFSLIFCALLLPILRATADFRRALKDRRIMLVLTAASFLICANWLIYVMATTSGHTIDASLGYFINPLVSVVLGVIFLQERLRAAQWVSVAISCIAVLMMSLIYGQVPWTGLGLAFSFGIYGLLKARVAHDVSPIISLSLETFILAPLGIA
ncbi:MAG: EamA family transporter RarD, partial [Rothia mucilaginosa]